MSSSSSDKSCFKKIFTLHFFKKRQAKKNTYKINKNDKKPLPTKLEIILEELHPVTCHSVNFEIEQI